MLDLNEILKPRRPFDVFKILSSNRESGRLGITAGATEGAFFFFEGKLVHARLGGLAGFQAVNAAVSMRECRLTFERSNSAPPTSNFEKLTERILLKELFGIATVGADPFQKQAQISEGQIEPSKEIPPAQLADSQLRGNELPDVKPVNPVTIPELVEQSGNLQQTNYEMNTSRTKSHNSQRWTTARLQTMRSWRDESLAGFYLTVLILLLGGVCVALINDLKDRRSALSLTDRIEPASAASPSTSSAPAFPANASSPVAKVQPVASVPESMPSVKRDLPPQSSKQTKEEIYGAHNLSGEWKVINVVQKTAYGSFANLELGFRVVINQNGSKFTATGEKISENGRVLPINNRTPIHLTGSIVGDRVEASFSERGRVRKTNGRFVWKVANAGAGLKGTFVSTAAKSSGTSAATREL